MGRIEVFETRAIELGGVRFDLTTADAGNPHAVTFAPHSDRTIRALGLGLATHPSFPQGTNVEFAQAHPDGAGGTRIDVVVWERGVGLTLACGTGACATLAVAVSQGLAAWDTPTEVRLPGGPLTITLRKRDGHAVLEGPARRVFDGVVEI